MNAESVLAVFMLGLLGGSHCLGMCGGLMAARAMESLCYSFVSVYAIWVFKRNGYVSSVGT